MPPPRPPPSPPDPYLYKLGALNWLLTFDGFFYAELTATPPDPARLGSVGDLPSWPRFKYPECRF